MCGKVYYARMSHTVHISLQVPDHLILSWMCAHVGESITTGVFNAWGSGWQWHYALRGSMITRMHKIKFEPGVDQELITQFALTFS